MNIKSTPRIIITARQQLLLDIANSIIGHDLATLRKDNNELLDTAIMLHESLIKLKIKFEPWKKDSDTLMTKFFFHSLTLEKILAGFDISFTAFNDPQSRKILDIPSSNVIHRAQLETFLMYHFLYVSPKTDEEKKFRLNVWSYSGLLNRQKLPATHDFSKKRKDEDKLVIEELKKEIENSTFFKKISPKQQKGILDKGEERLYMTWVNIMAEIGFSEKHMFSKPIYHVLSSYAHSSILSILQIKDSNYGYSENNQDAAITTYSSSVLIAYMIRTIKSLYPVIEIQYNGLSQSAQDKIELYALMATTPMIQ